MNARDDNSIVGVALASILCVTAPRRFHGTVPGTFTARRCRPLVLVLLVTAAAGVSSAADFTIDPAQTSFTLGGTTTGPNGARAFLTQSPGSLTASYTGVLDVDLFTPGTIQILGSQMAAVAQPGPFQPLNLPADYALTTIDFYKTSPSFGAIRNSTANVVSPATALEPSGAFDGHSLSMSLFSNKFDVAAAGLGSATTTFNPVMTNVAAQSPTLTTVGDQYRLEIPFLGTVASNVVGYPTVYNLSGTLVAYRPIAHATDPSLVNRGFEAERLSGPHDNVIQGWTVVGGVQANNFAGTQTAFVGMKPQPSEGVNEAFINVFNGSAGFYQVAIPAGRLAPHTTYSIQFDLGNRDLTDNGNLPNNDMDPFISLRAFFTLGSDGTDFSKHVGMPFVLNRLSDVAEGTFLKDQAFSLDTSTLSPEQLAQGLNVAFFATSTTELNRGQVNIDNVRLTIVPEPTSVVLVACGILGLLAILRRRV